MTAGFVGCVLAGGKSVRMGRDKALLTSGGVRLIERATSLLNGIFTTVVVSADRVENYAFLGLPVLPDLNKNCGPLGGIHAALTSTNAEHLFILACDMPFVSGELIRYLTDAHESALATVPSAGGRVHPLCGLYSRKATAAIEDSFSSGNYSMQELLRRLNAAVIPVTPDLPFYTPSLLDNINDPADQQRAEILLHQPVE